jgi:superfamily II DNA/RNA helicase
MFVIGGYTMDFSELDVQPQIVKALKENGITAPTGIQVKAIPLLIQGRDVVGMSRTGSGKTVAFGVPLVEKIISGQGLQALVLAPTRELAVQIAGELKKFAKYKPCKVTTIYGGVGIEPQIHELATADVVVGTPGRVLDHLGRRTMDITKLTCFVLDEADKMVEMGFIEDIENILQYAPQNKQVVLFGATLSSEIDYLKSKYMQDPVEAEAKLHVETDLLKQFYYNIQPHQKFSLLVHLLKKDSVDRAIIFCSTRSTVELLTQNLKRQDVKAQMIHGKMTQNKRLHVIKQFNEGKLNFLVASAVAARGLHIDGVTHVFNYDLSKDPQEYVHRVGRTARAGETGVAITLLGPQDHQTFSQILQRFRMDVEELPNEKFARLAFNVQRGHHDYRKPFRRRHPTRR